MGSEMGSKIVGAFLFICFKIGQITVCLCVDGIQSWRWGGWAGIHMVPYSSKFSSRQLTLSTTYTP